MKNKKALILLIIGIFSTIKAQSYLLCYKWQEGDVYHYKLTVKSPQFGTQEFFYDQIVEKLYTPGEASFTFQTPLGAFKAKSSDLQPEDGAAIVRIVYTKGTVNGKEVPAKELIKNLLLYIKPNGETYVLQRQLVSGVWVFELANVADPKAKEAMRKFFKSPATLKWTISDNTVLTQYDPDGIFHPVYLPDQPVTLGEKWNFTRAGVKAEFSFDNIAKIDTYDCVILNANFKFSGKEMMEGMPGMPEEMGGVSEISRMMPEFRESGTFYFEPEKGMLVRVIDRSEIKGQMNVEFDARLDLIGAELKSGQKVGIKTETGWEKKIEIKPGMEHSLYIKALFLREKVIVDEPTPKPIKENVFQKLLESLADESFESTRLEILEDATTRHYFTCQQLISILKLFTFETNKIQACKMVYPKLVDKGNFHTVYPSFTFSNSKTEIRKWILKYEKGEVEEKEDE